MQEDKKPDYFGNWAVSEFPVDIEQIRNYDGLESVELGWFEMFIEKQSPLSDGIKNIEGIIRDHVAEATFTGEIGPNHIKFVKRYPDELVTKGITLKEIPYEGKKAEEGTFTGTYKMEGDPSGDWKGQFILIKYFEGDFSHANVKLINELFAKEANSESLESNESEEKI